ncbi:hypothetical protein, partial [Microbacterium natoriense]|uniref:hypothetical protein n=1 Tax=Microbacterium natoriense TaxID=284570 RepID=UPI0031CEFE1F
KLSYSLASLAEATDLSVDSIQKAIKKDELVPSYYGSKPIILREEARRWLENLPTEKPERA